MRRTRTQLRPRPRVAPDTVAADLRDQQRPDYVQARGPQVAPLPLAPGRVLLGTLHVPTTVHVDEIAEVMVLPNTTLLGLRCRVTLRDGTQHFVPAAEDVLRAMREARR